MLHLTPSGCIENEHEAMIFGDSTVSAADALA